MMDEQDRKLLQAEFWISQLLRWGVVFCGSVILVGWVLAMRPSTKPSQLSMIAHEQQLSVSPAPRSASGLLHRVENGEPAAIISLGLFLLIALPVSRVALAGIIFLAQKDYVFVCLSAIVLTVLATSLLMGSAL